MTVTTSYPGVYIQELPNLTHTISPAPTSTAVFVGYTHPFATLEPLQAVQLLTIGDYQTNFGGLFYSPWQPDYVGQAVTQFFQNGGSTCYVVGLPALAYYTSTGAAAQDANGDDLTVAAATASIATTPNALTLTATQPVQTAATQPAAGSVDYRMTVTISNVQNSSSSATSDLADVVIAYGRIVDPHRRVPIGKLVSTLQASPLVRVTPPTAPLEHYPVPASGSSSTKSTFDYATASKPADGLTVITPGDYAQVFQDYTSLDKVPVFNLLATPGMADASVTTDAIAYCEHKRAFYIMETPSPRTSGWDVNTLVGTLPAIPVSTNAAVYYPWLVTTDPVTGAPAVSPPSGFVAGAYAREDAAFGVWKSPAGIETALLGTTGVDPKGVMTDAQQGILNDAAVDCLRQFPGIGTVIFGARTTAGATNNSAQEQWRYVAVRRMALFIEQTMSSNLLWAVHQGNAEPLWNALTQEVTAFMFSLFRQGAFAGTTPSEAFVVRCDSSTTTPTDVDQGRVNILVGFAPLKPAEFVIVQIAQLAGQA